MPAGEAGIISDEQILPDKIRSESASYQALAESGEILVESGRHDEPSGLHPGILTILDPATGKQQTIRGQHDRHEGTQTTFSAFDADHVVWLEQPDQVLSTSNWVMYAADRPTGKIIELARATKIEELDSAPTVPGYTIPDLYEGKVYWAEARPNPVKGKAPVVNIYSRVVDGSEPTTLEVRDAVSPSATGGWLYYAAIHLERPNEPGYAIHRKSLRTGKTELIYSSRTSSGFFLVAEGDTAAWVEDHKTVKVYKDARQIAQVRAPAGWLDAGRDAISFTANANYLLDLRTGCLHTLGKTHPSVASVRLAGTKVTWVERLDPIDGKAKVWHATIR
ncbi:hypothetical protein [Actinopolymorpha sp. B9G3]|uniref:hypothetical protein n=1 Tax=Actinopolymorpha sp. B9G3 TaxID=3158970 RepID=UPI0032D94A55